MAMRAMLKGFARAAVRSTEQALLLKAPAMGAPLRSTEQALLLKAPAMGAPLRSTEQALLLKAPAMGAPLRATEQALLLKAPAMGAPLRATEQALLLKAPAMGAPLRATEQALLAKAPEMGAPLRAGLTTNVGRSFAANAVASAGITASRLLTPKAAATVSRTTSWVTTPFAVRGMATASKTPPAGGGPLRYVLLACAVGGVVTVWLFLAESVDHVHTSTDRELLDSVDWSLLPNFPAVADPCYNNEFCGSCWAVMAIKSTESYLAIEKGVFLNLSIQQVIDCAAFEGCCGNNLDRAYKYMMRAGLTTEEAYPGPPAPGRSVLHGMLKGYCKMKGKPVVARITGYERIEPTEEALMRALQTGPVAVYVNINQNFYNYDDSVLEVQHCPPRCEVPAIKHVLLVVGYDTDPAGKKYWKLMNSWGPDWGKLGGYVKFSRSGEVHGVAGMYEFSGFRPVIAR